MRHLPRCRFDRQISIDRPDLVGREHIFRIHMAKLRLDKPIQHYSERMAALTPGFAGADIANVANEAALIAARQAKDAIGMVDFEAAVDRVIGGLEKKTKVWVLSVRPMQSLEGSCEAAVCHDWAGCASAHLEIADEWMEAGRATSLLSWPSCHQSSGRRSSSMHSVC